MSAPPRGSVLREFRRPRLWLAIGALGLLSVIVVSLLPARDLPPSPFSGFDKLGHGLAYAALSTYGGMLFSRMRAQVRAVAALVALGIGLEVAQALLTDSRTGDLHDAMANTLGVLIGLVSTTTPVSTLLQRIDARWP